MSNAIYYFAFCAANVVLLREVNSIVTEPYMVRVYVLFITASWCSWLKEVG